MRTYVGEPVARVEDRPLLVGAGQYVDDVQHPDMLHVAILGSPHAHARLVRVGTQAADAMPGVVRVITGEDLRAIGQPLRAIPAGWTNYPLAVGHVRYVGEPVAAVVATSRYVAADARELIEVDYEPLPAVTDAAEAMKDAVLLHPAQGTNLVYQRRFTYGDVDAAFQRAHRVVGADFQWGRASGNPMETGGCVCRWDSRRQELVVWTNMQMTNFLASTVAAQVGLPPDRLRMLRVNTGGSFGSKFSVAKWVILTGLIARQLPDRPLKFIEDRIDHLRASSSHGPERLYHAEAAVEADGRITALRVRCIDDLGAYVERRPGAALKPLASFAGCYDVPVLEYDVAYVVTNKCPQGAYRGYGVHTHNFVLERLVDMVADQLGLDPVELRRRNFIPADRFPYVLPTGLGRYDSGDYHALTDRLCELADYRARRAWQACEQARGRLVGIGVATAIELGGLFDTAMYTVLDPGAGGTVPERVEIGLGAAGDLEVWVGYGSEGQGQDTVVSQMVAEAFQVGLDRVRIHHADSVALPDSFGPGGSRMAVALAGAVTGAVALVRRAILERAATALGAGPGELALADGRVVVQGAAGRAMTLEAVAALGGAPIRLWYRWPGPDVASDGLSLSYLTAAVAAHLVTVEVDRETGRVTILDYSLVEDCGTVLNPAIVDGSTQGAIAQGVGQALHEEYIYDEQGQLLTGSFMEYPLPTAAGVPVPKKARIVTPSPYTPLGVKGTGEGAMNGTPAAVANAIADAVKGLGIAVTRVPVRPATLWTAIAEQSQRSPG
jgi:CO/xanthine dehydrogenase Mo-binding subunit